MLSPLNTALASKKIVTANVTVVGKTSVWTAYSGRKLHLIGVRYEMPGDSYCATGNTVITLNTHSTISGIDIPGSRWDVALPTVANNNLGEISFEYVFNGGRGLYLPSLVGDPSFDAGFPGAVVSSTQIWVNVTDAIPGGFNVKVWGVEY